MSVITIRCVLHPVLPVPICEEVIRKLNGHVRCVCLQQCQQSNSDVDSRLGVPGNISDPNFVCPPPPQYKGNPSRTVRALPLQAAVTQKAGIPLTAALPAAGG